MKKSKLAASLLAVTVSLSTLLTGCTTVPDTSGNSSSSTNSSNGGSSSSTDGNSSTSTGGDPSPDTPKLEFAQGTVLRMATGYNSKNTGLFFDADYVADKGENGAITLANGKSYSAGDLKPTWVAVQEKLGMVFENQYQGNSAAKEW